MTAPELLIPPPEFEERVAKLPPDRREEVAQFAARQIETGTFADTDEGRARAWKLSLDDDAHANKPPPDSPAPPEPKKEAAAEDLERFTRIVVSGPDFLLQEIPEPRSLVGNGLLCAGDLALLYGRPGSAKTWLALQLARALVRGEPWLGVETENGRPARVGILELELHEYRLRERLRTLGVGAGDGGLRLVYRKLLDRRVDLVSEADVRAIEKWCRDDGLDLLIYDALSRMHAVDENREMGLVLSNLDHLRNATGTAQMALHHEPKQNGPGRKVDDLDALRGDSRLQSDPGTLMRLLKLQGGLRVLRFVKVNAVGEPDPIYLAQRPDGTLEPTDPPERKGDANRDRVLRALEKLGSLSGTSRKAIEAEVGLEDATVGGHLNALEAAGKARRTGSARATLWWPVPAAGESGSEEGGGDA